jgi:hypothetical protein
MYEKQMEAHFKEKKTAYTKALCGLQKSINMVEKLETRPVSTLKV